MNVKVALSSQSQLEG